jgi:hypothetical protein
MIRTFVISVEQSELNEMFRGKDKRAVVCIKSKLEEDVHVPIDILVTEITNSIRKGKK